MSVKISETFSSFSRSEQQLLLTCCCTIFPQQSQTSLEFGWLDPSRCSIQYRRQNTRYLLNFCQCWISSPWRGKSFVCRSWLGRRWSSSALGGWTSEKLLLQKRISPITASLDNWINYGCSRINVPNDSNIRLYEVSVHQIIIPKSKFEGDTVG